MCFPTTECGPYLDSNSNKLQSNDVYEVVQNVNTGIYDDIKDLVVIIF